LSNFNNRVAEFVGCSGKTNKKINNKTKKTKLLQTSPMEEMKQLERQERR